MNPEFMNMEQLQEQTRVNPRPNLEVGEATKPEEFQYKKVSSRAEALQELSLHPENVYMYMDPTEKSKLSTKISTSNITLSSQYGLWPRPVVNIDEEGLGTIGVAVDKNAADKVVALYGR